MGASVEERLSQVEARLVEIETEIARTQSRTRPPVGITIEEARELLRTPVVRGPEQIEKFNRIFGTFDGPEDLATNMREYLNGARD